jgi:UDP-3-O-[3-hydroxymyristoyl] glucosamine N-acyltransferase
MPDCGRSIADREHEMPISDQAAIDSTAVVADDVTVGPFAVIEAGVHVGAGTRIGSHVMIHEGTQVGAGCELQPGAVLGKPPKLARHSSASRDPLDPLVIGDGSVICCRAIVFAGSKLAADVIIGDQAYVRERTTIGESSVVGRGSAVDNNVEIGPRVRIQTDVYITADTVVEADVFVGPGVCTTNDSTMARHDDAYPVVGPRLRRACRVGGGVVVCPAVEVGEEAFIAAGAVVTKDIPARGVAMGVPARVVREVPDEDLLEHWR